MKAIETGKEMKNGRTYSTCTLANQARKEQKNIAVKYNDNLK